MTPVRMQLRELRAEAGLSQEALAAAVNARQATISNLERGLTTRIEFELLDRLSDTLSRHLSREIGPKDLLVRVSPVRNGRRGRREEP